jgi:2-polyprenyl-3-methyl-5-hydroxy-6-metoxy-1,4-benzoquinol methylase
MDYETIEKERYEYMWRSLKGTFSSDPENYRGRYARKEILDFITFLKSQNIGGTVLDVGCGNGRNSVAFAKNNFKVYGIDLSTSAINLAKKNAKEEGVNINCTVGSVFDLSYDDNSFEVLVDSGCLHHLRKSEWKSYLRNILRVLKKDGYYFLLCFSKNSGYVPKFCPKSKNRNWTLRGMHYNHFFTIKEVKDFFGKDFDIIKNWEFGRKTDVKRFKVFYMRKQ